MAKEYDRSPVTIYMVKNALGLRKATDADMREAPDHVFTHEQARALWETFCGNAYDVSGTALTLYGDKMNAKGNYPEALIAATHSIHTSQRTGAEYIRNDVWARKQLLAFKPILVRLEIGFYGGPQLCAYMVDPPSRQTATKQRVIPDVKRIDPQSPEGQAIASANAPRRAGIQRRG